MNDKLDSLNLDNIASPKHGRDLPQLAFGSVSLSSQIKNKTTKHDAQKKIEFNTIQQPLSPKNDPNDSGLNFYADPDGHSHNRTETEIGGGSDLHHVPLDNFLEKQEAEEIVPHHKRTKSQRKADELKQKQNELKQQLELLEMNKKLMQESMQLKQQVAKL